MKPKTSNLIITGKNPLDYQTWIAELPSRYSQSPEDCREITATIRNAKMALSFLYISLYWNYWETEKITKSIAQQAYSHNYDGEWATVQEFLELEDQTPKSFENKYLQVFGSRSFFGNFLRNTFRAGHVIGVNDLKRPDTRRVARVERRRGYRDHGSLRPKHEDHGDPPMKEEKVDLRKQVTHPLLKEQKVMSLGESLERHFPKGGKANDTHTRKPNRGSSSYQRLHREAQESEQSPSELNQQEIDSRTRDKGTSSFY